MSKIIVAGSQDIEIMNPDPKLIQIEHVARGLARQFRFSGQTKYPYSVAAHSCLVAELLYHEAAEEKGTGGTETRRAQLAIAGLLHDASEAYLGDVVHPLKQLLLEYKRLEQIWMDAIVTRFSWELGPHVMMNDPRIKEADQRACSTEFLALFNRSAENEWGYPRPLQAHLSPQVRQAVNSLLGNESYSMEKDESRFLMQFKNLCSKIRTAPPSA